MSPLSPVAALLLAVSPAPPLVIGADGVLCDLTRTLAREQARVECLIPAGADPHTLALRPSDRRKLAQAKLVLINGYNLSSIPENHPGPWPGGGRGRAGSSG